MYIHLFVNYTSVKLKMKKKKIAWTGNAFEQVRECSVWSHTYVSNQRELIHIGQMLSVTQASVFHLHRHLAQ